MKQVFSVMVILLTMFNSIKAQNRLMNAAEIQQKLQKLNVVGNVLYMAAHPDDENTRLISWLANEKKVRTAYLSLTRGDGGQNLIGEEKGPLMGLIRTQELLEARKKDGGEQFFTRALDFGYSKSAKETLEKWDKNLVLSDVVRIIRKFKPDVIITRFPPTKRAGHGHHTTSAILAEEAFDAAADPTMFPESAKEFGAWKVTRLFFNNSPWWDKDIEKNKDKYVTVNIGSYNPVLGKAYSEIAGESRSQHQSQGFGAAHSRGNKIEYLQLVKGKSNMQDILHNIDMTWSRVPNIKPKQVLAIEKLIATIQENYNAEKPGETAKQLVELYNMVKPFDHNVWGKQKLKEIKALIASTVGLWMELLAKDAHVVKGNYLHYTAEAVLQHQVDGFAIKSIKVGEAEKQFDKAKTAGNFYRLKDSIQANELFQPYWLEYPTQENLFVIKNRQNIGKPESDAPFQATFVLQTPSGELSFKVPIRHKSVDRVLGELYRPVVILPALTAHFEEKAYLFTNTTSQQVVVKIAAHEDVEQAVARPVLPSGWKIIPSEVNLKGLKEGVNTFVTFTVTPPKKDNSSMFSVNLEVNGEVYDKDLIEIEYPHIETQAVLPKAQTSLIRYGIKVEGKKIGYIEGAGDEVPKGLEQLGYAVEFIDLERASLNTFKQYDVVVVGIRAFNTKKELVGLHPALMQYVEEGGHVVVQYTTTWGQLVKQMGPYPFKLSRDRVTKEEAPVTFLNQKHELFKRPNKITTVDFENWVQERGLYFANEWDSHYEALLGWNDPEEERKDGALLVTDYGKGTFIFTGISFFRQLPAGVPGAYRLFANIISYKQKAVQ